jgi:hypothetical protein
VTGVVLELLAHVDELDLPRRVTTGHFGWV